MKTNHWIVAGALLALGLSVGCGSDQPEPAQRVASHALLAPPRGNDAGSGGAGENAKGALPQDPAARGREAGTEATASSEDADRLARRAQAYALEMEQRMQAPSDKSAAKPPVATRPAPGAEDRRGGTSEAASQPSSVQWRERGDEPASIDATPSSANQAARIPESIGQTGTEPPVTPPAARPSSPDGAAPAQPAPPVAQGPTLDALSAKFARRIADNPRDIAGQLDYQLVRFLQDEQVPDLSAMNGLPQEDREMLSALMDGLSNLRSVVRSDNNMLLSRKIQPLLDMDRRLRGQSELVISTLALCTKVESYGVYEPLDPARFVAGRDHAIILYCAIDNFASQFNDKKLWETRLTQESVLYTESGLNVWSDKTTSIVDLSRQRRNDFFVVKMIKLPANLTIGRYLLKVTVIDQQVSRVAEATVPLQIVAK